MNDPMTHPAGPIAFQIDPSDKTKLTIMALSDAGGPVAEGILVHEATSGFEFGKEYWYILRPGYSTTGQDSLSITRKPSDTTTRIPDQADYIRKVSPDWYDATTNKPDLAGSYTTSTDQKAYFGLSLTPRTVDGRTTYEFVWYHSLKENLFRGLGAFAALNMARVVSGAPATWNCSL